MKTLITAILAAFVAVPTYARLTGTDPGTDIRCDGPSGAEICVDASGNLIPTTDNDATLGTSSLRFSTIHSLDQTIGDDLTVTDDLTINGDTTLGNASADVMTVNIGTIVVSNQVEGLVIATHTSVGGPVQTIMQIDGENRRICINCLSSEAASDALQVLDDGVALGAGTPTNTVGEGDLFVSDDLEVDGDIRVDLTATVTGATTVSSITASGLIRRTLPVAEVIGAGGIITADGCGGCKADLKCGWSHHGYNQHVYGSCGWKCWLLHDRLQHECVRHDHVR